MNRKLNTLVASIVLISVITTQNSSVVNAGKEPTALPGDAIITFEEPIAAPGNVESQYCANPGTNDSCSEKWTIIWTKSSLEPSQK